MASIFISYRREDTAGYAGWLHDRLSQHFGKDDVFRDTEAIEPGVDFAKLIRNEVARCTVLLAIIGPQWVNITDTQGQRRLDNPHDFVRLEIGAALEREIRVIPVLVHGASMPTASELPDVLVDLSYRNAFELRDSTFQSDLERLIQFLVKVLAFRKQVVNRARPAGTTNDNQATNQDSTPSAHRNQRDSYKAQRQAHALAAAHRNRGLVYKAQGQLDQALAEYTQAIQLNPEFAAAYRNRGDIYKAQGQLDQALAEYTQAIQLDPDLAAAYRNRGDIYKAKGQLDQALAEYTQAIQLNPDRAATYNNRGDIYKAQGQLDQALAEYTQAIQLDPDLAAAYRNRGDIYKAKGQLDHAVADYEEAVKLAGGLP